MAEEMYRMLGSDDCCGHSKKVRELVPVAHTSISRYLGG
jgi:hypothetical protein